MLSGILTEQSDRRMQRNSHMGWLCCLQQFWASAFLRHPLYAGLQEHIISVTACLFCGS